MLRNIRLQLHRLVRRPNPPKTRRKLDRDYLLNKELARSLILSRVAVLATLCQVSVKRVFIKNQRRRWGSCSSHGNLNFNYKLLYLPACLRDYVIIHELCHLKELNHSKDFWDLVDKHCPGYESNIREIKELEKETRLRPELLHDYRLTHSCSYCQT